MIVLLSAEDIIEIHDEMIQLYGGLPGIKEQGIIDYLAEKPYLVSYGVELYPTLFEKAAVLFVGVATAHAFVDANKRTAFATCATFLFLNGYKITADEDEIVEVAVRIADRFHEKHMELGDVYQWLIDVSVLLV
jgi:death-on-curing protein